MKTSSRLRRVLFISSGLHTGGAEMMLVKLLSRLHGRAIDAGVVSLAGEGPLSKRIKEVGVPVWHLDLDSAWHLPIALGRLVAIARCFRPEVIQGWMYHGNVAATLIKAGVDDGTALIWGIRQSLYDLDKEKLGTRWVIRWGAWFSRFPDAIVYNSETSRAQHEAFGYRSCRACVIDNGFDTDVFCPDEAARHTVRQELGIPNAAPVIGLIARYHRMKGHEVFLQAAVRLSERVPTAHFLLAGKDVVASNPVLAPWIANIQLAGRLHLLGERHDVPRLTAALDIASSSSSWGEAFPNVLGEAMACGVPCVGTDVGDTRRIIGKTGFVVPAGDFNALADTWQKLLDMPVYARLELGKSARMHVMECYSIKRISGQYAALYRGELQ